MVPVYVNSNRMRKPDLVIRKKKKKVASEFKKCILQIKRVIKF